MFKIIYACDFTLDKPAGKNRATRQKLSALSRNPKVDLTVFSAKEGHSFLFSLVANELRLLWNAFTEKPDVIITRGLSGALTFLFRPFLSARLVREVHAAGIEELKLLPFKGLKRFSAYVKLRLSLMLDCQADLRIFNHPSLMKWYSEAYKLRGANCFVYNGFDPASGSNLALDEARKKFGLDPEKYYLVFTGAASKWHGVDHLVALQRCFVEHNDNIQIVCGGGTMRPYDSERLCVNFSPLDDVGCADLIKAADACLLPVADVRVSPGSPLKLYDYMLNGSPVIAQSDQLGYSDEVRNHKVGINVDFSSVEAARSEIAAFLPEARRLRKNYPVCRASWDDRMNEWLSQIEEII